MFLFLQIFEKENSEEPTDLFKMETFLKLLGMHNQLLALQVMQFQMQKVKNHVSREKKQEKKPLEQLQEEWLFASQISSKDKDQTFYHGEGCHHCNGTGYRGRIGIYEFLEIDEAAGHALQVNDSEALAEAARAQDTYRSLPEHAMELAVAGITSLEEVFRVTEAVTDTGTKNG